MKTKEELNELKMPVELSDDALDNVIGGLGFTVDNKSIQKEMGQSIAQIDDNALKQTAQSTPVQTNQQPQGILSLLQ